MRNSSRSDQSNSSHRYPERLIYGVKSRLSSTAWLTRAVGVGLCVVSVVFIVLFLSVLAMYGQVGLFMNPLPKQVALILPYVIVVFTVGTVVGAGLGWWKQYWSLAVRIHQTILALFGIGFVWQLHALGFLLPN